MRKRDRRRQREEEARGLVPVDDVKHLTDQVATGEALDVPAVRTLQRTAGNQAVLRLGPGQPLDPGVRGRMEGAFGTSFDDVRVHTGAEAAVSARAQDAVAFAHGSDIVLGHDAPTPGTLAGDALLAHELAHVAQQRDAEPAVQAMSHGGAANSALERDADRSALRAISALWGNVRQNAMPALKSGVRPMPKLCGVSPEKIDEVPGDQLSDQIQVTIDEADRPAQGGSPEIEGTVSGIDEGVAQLYYTEEGDNCNIANAIELQFKARIRNGQYKIRLPATTSAAGIGKWVLVKAGDGTNFNYACAQIMPEGKLKQKVR